MSEQDLSIERLWYCAPSVARSPHDQNLSGEGFRICGLTRTLNNDKGGLLVRELDRYARYKAPRESSPDEVSLNGSQVDIFERGVEGTPICLALIDLQDQYMLENPGLSGRLNGRVLVHKVSIGRQGDGRPGNFFVDLLANLPGNFSAARALVFWRSNFWRTQVYIASQPGEVVALQPVVLAAQATNEQVQGRVDILENYQSRLLASLLSPKHPEREQIRDLLHFLIHAYLQQQDRQWQRPPAIEQARSNLQKISAELDQLKKEKGRASGKINAKQQEFNRERLAYLAQKRQPQIYVATEDDWLAYGLAQMVRLFENIPLLLEPLTFSTYEADVTRSDCQIVGTSAGQPLPEQGLVYNLYAPTNSDPAHHPALDRTLPFVTPLVRLFARELLKPGLNNDLKFALREAAKDLRRLEEPESPARRFLSICGSILFKAANLTRKEVEEILEPGGRLYLLNLPGVRRRLLEWIVADSMGIDLDQLGTEQKPLPFLRRPEQAGKWLDGKLLPLLAKFVRSYKTSTDPDDEDIKGLLLEEIRDLLESYADGLPQPEFLNIAEMETGETTFSEISHKPPRFDVITFCQNSRSPQPFEALIRVLNRFEVTHQNAPTWIHLLEYLFSSQVTPAGRASVHPTANMFVCTHLYENQLDQTSLEHHLNIHRRLLIIAASALPERRFDLVLSQILQVPVQYVNVVLGYEMHFKKDAFVFLPTSWQQMVLDYQLRSLVADKQIAFYIFKYWETHCLLLQIASACLDEQPRSLKQISPLLRISEAILPEFLSLQLRPEWNRLAVDGLLLGLDERPFASDTLSRLAECAGVIQNLLRQQCTRSQPANKESALRFYFKLVQSGFPSSHKKLLLETWHSLWCDDMLSTEELRQIIFKTTNLDLVDLKEILQLYKDEYKKRSAEEILVDLYSRCSVQQNGEDRRTLLFSLLNGPLVLQRTLNSLLEQARLETAGIVDFFTWFGKNYITAYFGLSAAERASWRNICELFSFICAAPELTNEVKLVILWIWLSASNVDRAIDEIRWLLERRSLSTMELVMTLATFGGGYMLTQQASLIALCKEYFKELCQRKDLAPVWKMQILFTLLQPLYSLPPLLSSPSPQDISEIYGLARISEKSETASSLPDQLHTSLGKQIARSEQLIVKLVDFEQKRYGDGSDHLPQVLISSLISAANRTCMTELAQAFQMFQREQGSIAKYHLEEWEIFLELQETRVVSLPAAQVPERLAPYLHYPVQFDGAFKRSYQFYLQHFNVVDFEQRRRTLALLNVLAGRKTSDPLTRLSRGWLKIHSFAMDCQGIARGWRVAQDSKLTKKQYPDLTKKILKPMEDGLKLLEEEAVHISTDTAWQLEVRLIAWIVPCLSKVKTLPRVLDSTLFTQKTLEQQLTFLEQMSRQTRTYYQHYWQNFELFLPYIELLAAPDEEFENFSEPEAERGNFRNRIWDNLFFADQRVPDGDAIIEVDRYLSENQRIDQVILSAWDDYKIKRRFSTLLPRKVPPIAVAKPMRREQSRRIFLWKSFAIVREMRKAIENADINTIKRLWSDYPDVLQRHHRQIGGERWNRLIYIKRFDIVDLALVKARKNTNLDEYSTYEQILRELLVDYGEHRKDREFTDIGAIYAKKYQIH